MHLSWCPICPRGLPLSFEQPAGRTSRVLWMSCVEAYSAWWRPEVPSWGPPMQALDGWKLDSRRSLTGPEENLLLALLEEGSLGRHLQRPFDPAEHWGCHSKRRMFRCDLTSTQRSRLRHVRKRLGLEKFWHTNGKAKLPCARRDHNGIQWRSAKGEKGIGPPDFLGWQHQNFSPDFSNCLLMWT